MLNMSRKSLAATLAVIALLDYIATIVVSANTATSYLHTELELPFPLFWLTIIVMIAFAFIYFLGLSETARVAFGIFVFHIITMLVLIITCIIRWGQIGNSQLIDNWHNFVPPSLNEIIKQVFFGFCIGLLGTTGFECTQSYIEDIKPNTFPKIMRNLWLMVFFGNTSIGFLATTIVPLDIFQNNSDRAISILGQYATDGQYWLRIWIVVDAVIVLCAGVLTGLVGVSAIFERLAW